ncbi:Flp pilus assembly complex ATPase component TadA [Heyndrickxia sporothermodurans]|uniref:ATPase, T2SS/T4P/T4SS family n=1 Tax=Heyndrickxia sporothermodurans TaxID=46224 RepID=UPI002DB76499|nr:ATPase, T2SS/T4P/T4SS family [Heyndrickxia sporothermodurans]MEB6550187.1 Flp pilus assembly complex ATPase component TadA [Heyndrickxia sporothermodurans]
MLRQKVNVFDINDYIHKNRIIEEVKEEKKKQTEGIHEVFRLVKDHFEKLYTSDQLTDEEKEIRQKTEHNAILGDKNSETILIPEINTFLRDNNLLGIKYPSFFESLAHAIYHEIYGFGVFYKWNAFPDSPSAKIIGKEIWFKINGEFVKQDEELRDEEHIYEIFRALEVANRGFKINESNPRDEIEMKDGTRVTISIPPASLYPTIVFRRFIVRNFSFEEQARRGTIPKEDIMFFNVMSRLYLNTVIAGEVESGKSTMLKTFYGARDPNKVAILIESSPETYLKRDFPERLVHDFYTLDDDIEETIRHALRVDHDYVIFQEVRGVEAEGAIKGTERGTRGLLMSYHITDPVNTPEQLAGHIIDEFPNRRLANEIRRISKQLDVGITMETFKGNNKRLTSIYEICYDRKTDKAWINYLMKYDPKLDKWEYNGDISEGLSLKIFKLDEEKAQYFVEHLKNQSKKYPLTSIAKEEIIIN